MYVTTTQKERFYNHVDATSPRDEIFDSRQPKFGKASELSVSSKIKVLPLLCHVVQQSVNTTRTVSRD